MPNTQLATLFAQARDTTESSYAAAREQMIALGVSAAQFLRDTLDSSAPESERWLAEILLARTEQADEFANLEKTFDEKVRLITSDFPLKNILGLPITDPAFTYGLLLPQEAAPTTRGSGADLSPALKEFFANTRIPDAKPWPPFLSEIVLKGWLPTTLPPPPPPKAQQKPTFVALDDFVEQAMLLVAKLNEQRATNRMLTVLQTPSESLRKRAIAARALGLLSAEAAVDALCQMAEDNDTKPPLRIEVFKAIGQVGSPKAAPALQRIAAWGDARLPGDLGPGRWAREARRALGEIRK